MTIEVQILPATCWLWRTALRNFHRKAEPSMRWIGYRVRNACGTNAAPQALVLLDFDDNFDLDGNLIGQRAHADG
jgi:hypothetical protein